MLASLFKESAIAAQGQFRIPRSDRLQPVPKRARLLSKHKTCPGCLVGRMAAAPPSGIPHGRHAAIWYCKRLQHS